MERNYPLDDVLYRYEHHVLPTFERYIKPYMDEADLVVNNNQKFDWGLRSLTGYLNNCLRNIIIASVMRALSPKGAE